MTVNSNNLFYLCSLVEFIGRTQGLERKAVVNLLGADNLNRIYEQADVLHCEPIEKIADEYIHYFDIQKGSFDNVGSCRYTVPDHFTIGKVYQRLIEDTLTDDNLIPHIMEVYNSWVSETESAIIIQISTISPELISLFVIRKKIDSVV